MNSRQTSWLVTIALITLMLVATAVPAEAQQHVNSLTTSPSTAAPVPADCKHGAHFTAKNFPRHPRVDNIWFPLVPGTNWVMDGTVVEEGVTHRHRIVTTVTDLTKVIDGVRAIVVFDRDFDNAVLQESELALWAQDRHGRVWNVGEYPEEYTDGRRVGAPSTWISGIAGARAGIGMQPHPRVGSPAYLQGVAPSVDFRDCAQVVRTGQRVSVPAGCYHHVLVTDEWAPLEPQGGHQLKYYAPGVGNVRIDAVGGDAPEVLRLTQRTTLSTGEMTAIRKQALAQDRRGYRISPKVYGRTPPATH